MSWIGDKAIENWFTNHAPTPEQVARLKRVREKARELALVVMEDCPRCGDQSAAIRKIREAVMTANAAIVCGPATDQEGSSERKTE